MRTAEKGCSEMSAHLDSRKCERAGSGGKPDVFPKGSILGSMSGVAAHLPDQRAGSGCDTRQHVDNRHAAQQVVGRL